MKWNENAFLRRSLSLKALFDEFYIIFPSTEQKESWRRYEVTKLRFRSQFEAIVVSFTFFWPGKRRLNLRKTFCFIDSFRSPCKKRMKMTNEIVRQRKLICSV